MAFTFTLAEANAAFGTQFKVEDYDGDLNEDVEPVVQRIDEGHILYEPLLKLIADGTDLYWARTRVLEYLGIPHSGRASSAGAS